MPAPPPTDADRARRDAETLLEAAGWIRAFRGRFVVVKLGGSALENTAAVDGLLRDVLFMETVGLKPVLVHGGGKAISGAMAAAGLEPRFVRGRRYTDEASLGVVADTLASISRDLAGRAHALGGNAEPLCDPGRLALFAKPLTLPPEHDGGAPVDLGQVGEVVGTDREAVAAPHAREAVPILPSLAVDRRTGGLLNVNADTAAAALARLLGAEKLVFLSDVPGLLEDPADPGSVVRHLSSARARDLIARGVIAGGMIPKVEAALEALAAGVTKIHFVDGRVPHSVLLEIYSDTGVGTEVVRDAAA